MSTNDSRREVSLKQHEREFFVSRIRSGIYEFKVDDLQLSVLTPTIQDEYYINKVYSETYYQSQDDGIQTQDETLEWMRENDFWTDEDDVRIKGLEKDIERLKVEIFNNRNNEKLVAHIRNGLRQGEKQLIQMISKKNQFFENTCEGMASMEKSLEFIRRCTFYNGKVFDFSETDPTQVLGGYYNLILSDSQAREIAKQDPWRSLWVLNDISPTDLFFKNGRELSIDQKNLIVWSRMYDNVQESLDCPSEDVTKDDDMLDGWFIIQKRKRDKERAESEMENSITNDKIKNAGELFIMAGSNKDAERINSMNDINSTMIKKQRMATIKSKGEAQDIDFQDQRLQLTQKSNEMYKDKFRR
jgi:hypothetical protein